MFINPKTFHLTVLMMKLWNDDQIKADAKVLQSVSPKVNDALKRRPVSIRLKGLGCMRGSPAKAYVVHAPVEVIGGEARLLDACKEITKAFTEAGLVLEKDAKKKLELHATIVNAKHRKRLPPTYRFLMVAKRNQKKLSPLMHEQFLVNLAQKSGECVVSVKLIFHKGLPMIAMVISVAVLSSHFLKRSTV